MVHDVASWLSRRLCCVFMRNAIDNTPAIPAVLALLIYSAEEAGRPIHQAITTGLAASG